MKTRLREKNNLFIILIYVAVLTIYHLVLREYGGDTMNFYASQMGGRPTLHRIVEIMKESYYGLSSDSTSRVLVEIPLFIITNGMHMWLFVLSNIIMHILMIISLMRITDYRHNKLLLCLLLMYPVFDLHSAGWITVYISYFWPLAAACVAFVSLKKIYDGESIGIAEGIFYILCELYGTNLEIVTALYLGVLIMFTIVAVLEHKCSMKQWGYIAVHYLVCLGNFVFILTCPGNYTRTLSDIRYWFPDYPSLTLADKITIGVNTVMSELTDRNLLWGMMCMLLMITVVCRYLHVKSESVDSDDNGHALILSVISAIPITSVVLRTVLRSFSLIFLPEYTALFDEYSGAARVDATNYNNLLSYFPFIFFMAILLIVLVSLILTSHDTGKGMINAYLLLIGLATRMVLAFSPSVYASGRRTMIVIDYMLIYLMVRIYDEHAQEFDSLGSIRRLSRLLIYVLTIFIVISNVISVGFDYYYGITK